MKNNYIKIVSVFLLFLSNYIFSQNDPLGGKDSLILERERVEDLPPIVKPFPPFPVFSLPDKQEILKYEPPKIDYLPALKPLKITPMGAPKPKWKPLYPSYLLLAGGRFATIYSELSYANGRNTQKNYGVHYKQRSALKGHQKYATFGIHKVNAFYETYKNNHTLGANANFTYQKHTKYGYKNIENISKEIIKDSLKTRWTKGHINLFVKKDADNKTLSYNTPINIYFYSDLYANKEFFANLNPSFKYYYDRFYFDTELLLQYNSYKYPHDFTGYNLALRQSVGSSELVERLDASIGMNIYYTTIADSNTKLLIFPTLKAKYKLNGNNKAYFSVSGSQQLLTKYFLSEENFYLDTFRTSAIITHTLDGDLGIKGHINSFNYGLNLTLDVYNNLPAYSPDTTDASFGINYISTTFTGATFFGEYNIKDIVILGSEISYLMFEKDTLNQPYGVPNLNGKLYIKYKMQDKIDAELSIDYIGKRYLYTNTVAKDFLFPKLSTYYHFSDRISIFVIVNNLLNQNYYRWYLYKERPLDILIGGIINF